MSFQYKPGQIPFEEANQHTPFVELLGEVSENIEFPRHGSGINSVANRVIRAARKRLNEEEFHAYESKPWPLKKFEKYTIIQIIKKKDLGINSAKWIYEHYASHATPVESKMEKPNQVDPSNKIKEFCMFKVDGVTYLKYHCRIIPFSDIQAFEFYDEENRLLQKKEGEIPDILSIAYKSKDMDDPIKYLFISEIEVDDVELQKLIDIFNTY
jgi:hypothetical protein